MRVPAVVGSWPEPFLQASAGLRAPARSVSSAPGRQAPCEAAEDALADAGVSSTVIEFGDEVAGQVASPDRWRVERDPHVTRRPRCLSEGPSRAESSPGSRSEGIELLDERGQRRGAMATGLVAATRNGEGPPTWIVTGTSEDGVLAAVELLDSDDAPRPVRRGGLPKTARLRCPWRRTRLDRGAYLRAATHRRWAGPASLAASAYLAAFVAVAFAFSHPVDPGRGRRSPSSSPGSWPAPAAPLRCRCALRPGSAC